ncbi:two pore domain potassium channel family protein [Kitasatospora acidiphila]|uniref:Two pore domain potassium channel family protein n=1 Tax=Kitasatospora acidiphila TaxID=2567942 RepID=A0A540WGD7_9ACTN|nr:two pore domain potassium channel family protein [Kitasatospora acidiphila]
MLTVYFTVPLGSFGPEHPVLSWTVFLVFLTALAALLVHQIALIMRESDQGLPGLAILAVSILTLVAFSAAYFVLARRPGEFSGLQTRLDALYFTVVTMATVGYGDIVATGQSSRVVVVVQIVYTLVFLAAGFTALGQRARRRIGSGRHADDRSGHG